MYEIQCESKKEDLPDWYLAWKTQYFDTFEDHSKKLQSLELCPPPEGVFSKDPKHGTWDSGSGLPSLTLVVGQDMTKSASEASEKLCDNCTEQHAQWNERQPKDHKGAQKAMDESKPSIDMTKDCVQSRIDWDKLLGIQILTGSFGKRQGLELNSDMGPFCHVLQI